VWTLWASAFFIANGLNNWMPTLYTTVYHLGLKESLRAAAMTNVAQVAVLLICAFASIASAAEFGPWRPSLSVVCCWRFWDS